ncbi:unnamed protein product [Polarella glacialis]|uniref:Ubiquitin-like domain-containing protein n=1 Tax=Polarella glacialis TaxID=89957 RepID=A0A813DCY7_POLGL|nr:unnamed protein product [Polarella glacialis]
MIKFILMVNKQGQTRLAQYYDFLTVRERVTLEGELIRKCLSRNENQCSFVEYRQYRVVYRRYASLYFIVGTDNDDECNELALLEFIHTLVETLDKYFENVCELDIMFNLEKAHIILDEMVLDGYIPLVARASVSEASETAAVVVGSVSCTSHQFFFAMAETAEAAAQHIQLKVKDQQGSEVQFKIKKSTPLRKLMDAYCIRLGLQASQVRFMVDGERIAADDTAEKLGLEDEDLIDVAMEQTGGC